MAVVALLLVGCGCSAPACRPGRNRHGPPTTRRPGRPIRPPPHRRRRPPPDRPPPSPPRCPPPPCRRRGGPTPSPPSRPGVASPRSRASPTPSAWPWAAGPAAASLTAGSGVAVSWDGAAWSDPVVYYPAPATGAVTAPVLPAIACTSGPSCVIVDGSGHLSYGDGTTWSPPVALAAVPRSPRQPRRPGPRSDRLAVRRPVLSDARRSAPSWTTPGRPTCCVTGRGSLPSRSGSPEVAGSSDVSLYQPGRVGVSCPDSASVHGGGGRHASSTGTGPPGRRSRPPGRPRWCPGPRTPRPSPAPPRDSAWWSTAAVSPCGPPGTGWSTEQTVDPHGGLDSLSCPTASFCVAADEGGSVVSWNGSTWSPPDPDPPGGHRLSGHRDLRLVSHRPVLHGHEQRRGLRHLRRPGRPLRSAGCRSRISRSAADAVDRLHQRQHGAPVAGGGRRAQVAFEIGVVELGRRRSRPGSAGRPRRPPPPAGRRPTVRPGPPGRPAPVGRGRWPERSHASTWDPAARPVKGLVRGNRPICERLRTMTGTSTPSSATRPS